MHHLKLAVCALFLVACGAERPLDLNLLSQEIHRLTNELRVEQHLTPLSRLPELDQVSLQHSQDMAERQYFEHTNPDGLEPYQRLAVMFPNLLNATSGENIVMRSRAGQNEKDLATVLLKLWRESPEHYAHLIEPDFWQLGVGLAQVKDVVYATQTFTGSVVLLESGLSARVSQNQKLKAQFRFLAPFPAQELQAFLIVPDSQARIPNGNGQFYLGRGPIAIKWSDNQHFSIQLTASYGSGSYQILFGRKGEYYQRPYRFEVS